MSDEVKIGEVVDRAEIVRPADNAMELMERAQIDVQISTANRYPRSLTKFNERAKSMVSVDLETAESCIYRRPVGKEGGSMKYVEGESIRLAEIVAACYGNIRVGAIITEMEPRYVKAVGMAHDLESNYAAKAEVVESTVDKYGKPFSERMRVVVAKAAQSKAMRDAIFRVVPKSLCKSITNLAYQVIAGQEKPIGERRKAVEQWLCKLSIEPSRIFAALGVSGIEEMGNEQLMELTGLRTALKDGEITLDEAFPPLANPSDLPGGNGSKMKLGKQQRAPASQTPPATTDPGEIPFGEPEPEPEIQKPQPKFDRRDKGGNGKAKPVTSGGVL